MARGNIANLRKGAKSVKRAAKKGGKKAAKKTTSKATGGKSKVPAGFAAYLAKKKGSKK